MPSSLRLENLSLSARLGVSAEERSNPQEVRLRVELRFFEAPHGASTDEIRDTICYARLAEALRSVAAEREFHLIEHLAEEGLRALRRIVEARAEIGISVQKVRPPVPGLLGGAFYSSGDFFL